MLWRVASYGYSKFKEREVPIWEPYLIGVSRSLCMELGQSGPHLSGFFRILIQVRHPLCSQLRSDANKRIFKLSGQSDAILLHDGTKKP